MSKKHYIMIASIIQKLCFDIPSLCKEERQKIAELFADKLQDTNPLFDSDRFIIASTKDEARKM